jgi:hypothetical protein
MMKIVRRLRSPNIKTHIVEAVVVVALIAISEIVTQLAQRAETPTEAPKEAAAAGPANTSTPRPTATRIAQHTPTALPAARPSATPVVAELTALTAEPTPIPTAFVTIDGWVNLGDIGLLELAVEAPQCAQVGEISYSPTRDFFLVILACQASQDVAFLFRADGSDKRAITGPWDFFKDLNHQWAPDGGSFVYERINACCVPPSAVPPDAPLPGLVRYDVEAGEKHLISKYRVAGVHSWDALNVRTGPGVEYPIAGEIPFDGKDVAITGVAIGVGSSRWVPVRYREVTGWVNMKYIQPQVWP